MIVLHLVFFFMKLIGIVIALILGLVLLLLIAPIYGKATIVSNEINFQGHYLFRLLSFRYFQKSFSMKFMGFSIRSENKKKKESKEKKIENKEKKKETKKGFLKKRGLPSKNVIFLFFSMIKDLIVSFAPRKAELKVELGLDDPYDSGFACMISNTLFIPLNRVRGYRFKFIPLYDDLDLKVDGEFVVRFSLIHLIVIVLKFAIKKPVRDYMGWHIFKKTKKTNEENR